MPKRPTQADIAGATDVLRALLAEVDAGRLPAGEPGGRVVVQQLTGALYALAAAAGE